MNSIVCPWCDTYRTDSSNHMDAHLLIEHPGALAELLDPDSPGAKALKRAPIGPSWPGEEVAW